MVNGYLLDTSVVFWVVGEPGRLTARVRAAVEQGPAWLSVISYWEAVIKAAIGRIDIGPVEDWWREAARVTGARVLPMREDHVSAMARLPLLHRDPFDRALIAQAITEEWVLLTADRTVMRYAAAGLQWLR
ncbi:MAG: type II toxin-antitoxin system VapC family toxin [Terriglobales bacterium]